MTAIHSSALGLPRQHGLTRAALAVYAVTLFCSALLLFLLQPMFAKMVLPRLGGSPSVWSVAMVFYQTALLAGYGYAHLLNQRLAPPRAALVHFAVLGCAAITLPIGIAAGFDAPPVSGFIGPWLFALFALSIGLPFMALAASAPMLQHWFAASGHAQARNPYVLYAASNIGSFTALLTYPFVIEPLLTLHLQAVWWSFGFAALAIFIAVAGLVVAREAAPEKTATHRDVARPTVSDRLWWIVLSAIPSGLVIAVTAFISTDVAAAPFLWVIPLSLFLLTFVAVFRERPWFEHATLVRLAPLAAAPVSITLLSVLKPHWLVAVSFNLLLFVLLALVCHGELYRKRPSPARLTEFYLFSSLGGVLGGAFAGLLAPHIFSNIYEYPILILAALAVGSGTHWGGISTVLRQTWPILLMIAGVIVARVGFNVELPDSMQPACVVAGALIVIGIFLYRQKPAIVVALAGLAFLFTGAWTPGLDRVSIARSFFGIHQVIDSADGRYRVLFHGTTIHGAMELRDKNGAPITGRPESLTYYYFGGPIAEGITLSRAAHPLNRVAVVGLGAGTLACHRQEKESWTFYEIDPEVVHIARDPKLFRFLSECEPDAPVVVGDARLTLAQAKQTYDLIVLDAFSSDTIPVHLLTKEALATYLSRLSPNGQIVFHISNRHFDLTKSLSASARAMGLVAYYKSKPADLNAPGFKSGSNVMLLTRAKQDLAGGPEKSGWVTLDGDDNSAAWSDDFANILGALNFQINAH